MKVIKSALLAATLLFVFFAGTFSVSHAAVSVPVKSVVKPLPIKALPKPSSTPAPAKSLPAPVSNFVCPQNAAEGCWKKTPGYTFLLGDNYCLQCFRNGDSCGRADITCPEYLRKKVEPIADKKKEPTQAQKNSALSLAKDVPVNTQKTKIESCAAINMVYVGGCVSKCLPQTKTGIDWAREICGWDELYQQDVSRRLNSSEEAVKVKAKKEVTNKKNETEELINLKESTDKTLETYDTGPDARRNCKNIGGTYVDYLGQPFCVDGTHLDKNSKEVNDEFVKIVYLDKKAKEAGQNRLEYLVTHGGDGKQCLFNQDCISNICDKTGSKSSQSVVGGEGMGDKKVPVGACSRSIKRVFVAGDCVDGSSGNNVCGNGKCNLSPPSGYLDDGITPFGKCEPPDACERDNQCPDGMICNSSACVVGGRVQKPAGINLPIDASCISNDQCESENCDLTRSSKYTTTGQQVGVCAERKSQVPKPVATVIAPVAESADKSCDGKYQSKNLKECETRFADDIATGQRTCDESQDGCVNLSFVELNGEECKASECGCNTQGYFSTIVKGGRCPVPKDDDAATIVPEYKPKCNGTYEVSSLNDCIQRYSVEISTGQMKCVEESDGCGQLEYVPLKQKEPCVLEQCMCVDQTGTISAVDRGDVCTENTLLELIGVSEALKQLPEIETEKLCEYSICNRFGTWCEPLGQNNIRCRWGFTGAGYPIKVLQPGERCDFEECACTVLKGSLTKDRQCFSQATIGPSSP